MNILNRVHRSKRSTRRPLRILWCDDKPESIDDIKIRMEKLNTKVSIVNSIQDAITYSKNENFDILFIDYKFDLPNGDSDYIGYDIGIQAQEVWPDKPRILVTEFKKDYCREMADKERDPFDYLIEKKDLSSDSLVARIDEFSKRVFPQHRRYLEAASVGYVEAMDDELASIIVISQDHEEVCYTVDAQPLKTAGIRKAGAWFSFESIEDVIPEREFRISIVIHPRNTNEIRISDDLIVPDLNYELFQENQDD